MNAENSRPPAPRPFADTELLTAADLAAILGVSVRTAYRIFARPGFPKTQISAHCYRVAGWRLREWWDAETDRQQAAAAGPVLVRRRARPGGRHDVAF